jgi:hypothetical protein
LGAAVALPQNLVTEHNIGNLTLAVGNTGMFGTVYSTDMVDCFTGQPLTACQFPKGSDVTYLWAGNLWVGGIVNGDTLVSAAFDGWSGGFEFFPDQAPLGQLTCRSSISTESPLRVGARSHQDIGGSYFDTCTNCPKKYFDRTDNRYHKPIGLRVDQNSFAWDYPHAENTVIICYAITNIGSDTVHDAFVGAYIDGDVSPSSVYGAGDDIAGFRNFVGLPGDCDQQTELQLGWICDNEGDTFDARIHTPHVTGAVLLTQPATGQHMTFNWWSPAFNYGSNSFVPMRKSIARDFGAGGTGIPYGDKNKYYLLSNGDIDYDQPFAGKIGPDDSVWVFPGEAGGLYAQGADVRYLLSVGPWDLAPDQQAEFAIAYVCGYNLHTTWGNEANLPSRPDIYMNWLSFSDLEQNALNAKHVRYHPPDRSPVYLAAPPSRLPGRGQSPA